MGQSLVEFALVLPLLLLLLVAILDFGRAVYASHTIGNAARHAVRLAIVDQNQSNIDARAEAHSVGLNISVATAYWNPIPSSDPTSNAVCSPVRRECIAIVEVETTFQPATPIIGGLIGPIELNAITEMPVERQYASP